MVLSSASADCHHCAERYVGPWYQRCSPDAAEAASVTNVGRAGRGPLAHSRLRAAVTASRRTRKRARGERERIMGAWVDPVPAPGESCAAGQRALNDSPSASITAVANQAWTWANRATSGPGPR